MAGLPGEVFRRFERLGAEGFKGPTFFEIDVETENLVTRSSKALGQGGTEQAQSDQAEGFGSITAHESGVEEDM